MRVEYCLRFLSLEREMAPKQNLRFAEVELLLRLEVMTEQHLHGRAWSGRAL